MGAFLDDLRVEVDEFWNTDSINNSEVKMVIYSLEVEKTKVAQLTPEWPLIRVGTNVL